MGNWIEWSDWLKEGYFISFKLEGTTYYEHIIARDLAHWEYDWFETIEPYTTSGPVVPEQLILTKRYDPQTNTNQLWQMIFGIQGEVYIYIELPTDTHRHGIPKIPKPSSTEREISHFEEWMSPFVEPTFLTEHFMIRPNTDRIAFDAYNPCAISITPKLNIFIAKMITERLGTERNGVLTPTSMRYKEILDRLYRRVVTCRPLTLLPVYAPPSE